LEVRVSIGNAVPGTGPNSSYVSRFPLSAITSIRILAEDGDDQITLDYSQGDIPVSISVDGDDGRDRLVVNADSDFTLANDRLDVAGFSSAILSNIEDATLFGGNSDNRFDVSRWTGTAFLSGGNGRNTVVSGNDDLFTLSDRLLRRFKNGNL